LEHHHGCARSYELEAILFSNPVINHLKTLVGLGPRPIASPANQSAANYIRDTFSRIGLDVEEQPYECTAWEHSSTLLEVDGFHLSATANAFSLPCDVTAPILSACSIAELETISLEGPKLFKKHILLLYGDLTRAPIAAKSWFLKEEHDIRIVELIEAIQPAAMLAPPTGTDYYGQATEDWELDLAAATISNDTALQLLHQKGKQVHLLIDSHRLPAKARNILARTSNMVKNRLVLCAHFDTKINTPGATDNACAIACLLALAESLISTNLTFGLEFIAFNGEEYLPLGDDEYLKRSNSYFKEILACINMDGIGPALGTSSITAMACSPELEEKLKTIASHFPGVVWVPPWPESNHSTFAMRGIPAVALGSVGMRDLAHSTDDGLEKVDPEKLNEVVSLVTEIVKWFP
jgi:aminopeptidase YwaD